MFDLDMHFSDIISAAGNSLHEIFFQPYLLSYQLSYSLECCIYRAVASQSSTMFLTVYDQFDSGRRLRILTAHHLQIFQSDFLCELVLGYSCYDEKVSIIYSGLAVRKFKETSLSLIKEFLVQIDSQTLEMMIKRRPAASRRQFYNRVADTHFHRIYNLVTFSVLEYSILMDS